MLVICTLEKGQKVNREDLIEVSSNGRIRKNTEQHLAIGKIDKKNIDRDLDATDCDRRVLVEIFDSVTIVDVNTNKHN